MKYPFKGKTEDESARIISNKWDYSKPLLLKPKANCQILTESKILEMREDPNVRLEQLPDGRILSLTKEATNVLFENDYIVDITYVERKY